MKLEKLRIGNKKQIVIGALAISIIGGVFTFNILKTRDLSQDKLLIKGKENYQLNSLETIAMYQQSDSGSYTEITEMPSTGYVINEDKTYCTTDNKTQVKGKIKTIDGNHIITDLNKSDKCYVWFDKKKLTIPDIIAAVNSKDTTPDFSQVATTDEGVYAVSDGMYGGTSYYWRGAVTNNYVKFAGFCWRIIRINGDGSIRLIYDGTTCHANGESTTDSLIQPTSGTTGYPYNASYNQSNYVGWTYEGQLQRPSNNNIATSSNAKIQTENWFDANITETNLTKVDTSGKYCNDRDIQSGSTWAINGSTFYYAAFGRINTNTDPVLNCSIEDIYKLKAGAITADEALMAGGKYKVANNNYYLFNGKVYWTMTPSYWVKNGYAYMFSLESDGNLNDSAYVYSTSRGLRPVINLKSDITFSSGDGTQSDPYVVAV